MHWYLEAMNKYGEFDGRARRAEYWWFVLVNFVIGLVLGLIDGYLGVTDSRNPILLGGVYPVAGCYGTKIA